MYPQPSQSKTGRIYSEFFGSPDVSQVTRLLSNHGAVAFVEVTAFAGGGSQVFLPGWLRNGEHWTKRPNALNTNNLECISDP